MLINTLSSKAIVGTIDNGMGIGQSIHKIIILTNAKSMCTDVL
jgi:hypothetical protein